ncbi:MAG: YceI family protein [Paracoccaceae bacterium]
MRPDPTTHAATAGPVRKPKPAIPPRRTFAARAVALALTLALTTTSVAVPAAAAPVAYELQAATSVVAFETDYGDAGIRITGRMPIAAADLAIDFARVANSRVDVTIDATDATTSNPLATGAMLGPKVLSVDAFPTLRFTSTKVSAKGDGAEIEGNLTIRDVTRPVILQAMIYRQKGSAEGDLTRLSILLTGAVSRAAYGAGGFPDMVGDQVRLKILARIVKP